MRMNPLTSEIIAMISKIVARIKRINHVETNARYHRIILIMKRSPDISNNVRSTIDTLILSFFVIASPN